MNSKDLDYVLTIAQTKNFSKAAELLYISQPALSQYINRLEASLGVQLFFRSRSQVLITPAGEEFARRAANIRHEIAALEHAMREFSQRKQELSFGVSQFYGKHVLSSLITGLQQNMPQYHIKIIDGESHFLEELISQQKLDFGIFPSPIYNSGVTFAPIYEEQVLFAFNKKNASALRLLDTAWNGKSINLRYYKDFPFILLREGLKLQELSLHICEAYGFRPEAVYQSENLDTVYSLVANNYGVAFLPSTICHNLDSSKSDVLFFPVKSRYSSRFIGLAYLGGLYEEKFIKKIVNAAKSGIPKQPPNSSR